MFGLNKLRYFSNMCIKLLRSHSLILITIMYLFCLVTPCFPADVPRTENMHDETHGGQNFPML